MRVDMAMFIGAGVTMGRDCLIGSNCTIDCAYLGDKVVVQGAGFLNDGDMVRVVASTEG